MDEPTSYPSWRFWSDGRMVIVETPAELWVLPPGHAGSPAGPFPDEEETPDDPGDASDAPEDEIPDPAALQDEARALWAQGHTVQQIAQTVGRSPRTVGRWVGRWA